MEAPTWNGIKNLSIFTVASLLALAVGFGYSGGIFVVSGLLPYSVPFIANLLFAISVITWGALQFSGMKSLFSFQKKEVVIRTAINNHTEEALKILIAQFVSNGSDLETLNEKKDAIKRQLLVETKKLVLSDTEQLKISIDLDGSTLSKPYAYTFIKYVDVVRLYIRLNRLQKTRRQTQLEDFYHSITNKIEGLSGEYNLTDPQSTKLKQSATYVIESLDQILPQTLPVNGNELYHRTIFFLMDIMTHLNALFINSVGLAVYGGFSLISMLGIQSVTSSYVLLGLFGFVGYTGAKSFSRPMALNATQMLFGYSKDAKEAMTLSNKQKENHGFFALSARSQQLLAIFMASGIAISNYIANTAFGEFLFAGKSIFEVNGLMSALVSNPFAASAYSVAFGLMAGICTFFIVASLLLNGTLSVTIKSDKPLRNIPSKLEYLYTILLSSGLVLFLSAISLQYAGFAVISALSSQAQTIMLTSLLVAGSYLSYRHCQENTPMAKPQPAVDVVSNLFISTTVLVAALTSAYLNNLPGSAFFIIFGPNITPFVALLIGVANLELGLAMFRCAKGNLDAIFKTVIPEESFSKAPQVLKRYSHKLFSPKGSPSVLSNWLQTKTHIKV